MSKRKIFEAQMCTVGLESDPGVIAYMDAVFDGKTPSNQINESVSIISNQESFSKLFNRAKIVAPHTAMKISESNWDDVSKATMYASAISGMMLVEADKKFKLKRGTTVERDGETYKFIGHAWVKYDPEATTKKKQWLPFSDKELKQELTSQAEEDDKVERAEAKRQAARADIEKQSNAAKQGTADREYAQELDKNSEWEAEQRAEADKYHETNNASDAEWEAEQKAEADQYKSQYVNTDQYKGSKIEPSTQYDQEVTYSNNNPQNVAAKEPDAYTSNDDPEVSDEPLELSPQIQQLANKLENVDKKTKKTVIRLLSVKLPWADIAASAIIDGTVNDVLKHLKSSDK